MNRERLILSRGRGSLDSRLSLGIMELRSLILPPCMMQVSVCNNFALRGFRGNTLPGNKCCKLNALFLRQNSEKILKRITGLQGNQAFRFVRREL